jgi:hypothetical protein
MHYLIDAVLKQSFSNLHAVDIHYNLNASFAQPSNLDGTPAFAFPGRMRTFETPNPDLPTPFLRVPKLSSNVPSVNVAELGDALGLFLDPLLSLRRGTSAEEAFSGGCISIAYGCPGCAGSNRAENGANKTWRKARRSARRPEFCCGRYNAGGGATDMQLGGGESKPAVALIPSQSQR